MISRSIIEAYAPLIKDYTLNFDNVGTTSLYIPKFTKDALMELCKEAEIKLRADNMLLELKSPMYIVGDIHGSIRDLLRLIANTGSPQTHKYLFLGDYVDRGEMSVEVLTLLFAMKISYPHSVYLLRGNHEFMDVNAKYGFKDQVEEQYDKELFYAFNQVFWYLPLAAIVDKNIFVVHGGISPQLTSLSQIADLKRPIISFKESEIVEDIVWSDPIISNTLYSSSTRGFGFLFGRDAIGIFLSTFKFRTIIRGHQCVARGVDRQCNDILITVFSCSNYANVPNKSGLVCIEDGKIETMSFNQLKRLFRKDAVYKDIEITDQIIPKCGRMAILSFGGSGFYKRKKLVKINAIGSSCSRLSKPIPISPSRRIQKHKVLSVEPNPIISNSSVIKCATPPLLKSPSP